MQPQPMRSAPVTEPGHFSFNTHQLIGRLYALKAKLKGRGRFARPARKKCEIPDE